MSDWTRTAHGVLTARLDGVQSNSPEPVAVRLDTSKAVIKWGGNPASHAEVSEKRGGQLGKVAGARCAGISDAAA
eukprot:5975291-Alexandrium_andersonii.AAC.1